MTTKVVSIFLSLILLIHYTNSQNCPDPLLIYPCTCQSGSALICTDDLITQDVINNLFLTYRVANNLTLTDIITLQSFTLQFTPLKELDLTPFLHSHIDSLYINSNIELEKVFGPLINSTNLLSNFVTDGSADIQSLIHQSLGTITVVNRLSFYESGVTDEGLQDTFLYFDSNLKELLLNYNFKVRGGSYKVGDSTNDIEFLPGLSAFVNLTKLDLSFCNISILNGGQFSRNNKLESINFNGNNIIEIGKDAFRIVGQPGASGRDILLEYVMLDDEKIHPENGLQTLNGITRLDLQGNQFEFASAANFLAFLNANEGNSIEFWGNIFICDERMLWLKEGRDQFEYRVNKVDCVNDPGKTIFTTELVG